MAALVVYDATKAPCPKAFRDFRVDAPGRRKYNPPTFRQAVSFARRYGLPRDAAKLLRLPRIL
jgi:hypothetical protein